VDLLEAMDMLDVPEEVLGKLAGERIAAELRRMGIREPNVIVSMNAPLSLSGSARDVPAVSRPMPAWPSAGLTRKTISARRSPATKVQIRAPDR
jgi:hypothetical protein